MKTTIEGGTYYSLSFVRQLLAERGHPMSRQRLNLLVNRWQERQAKGLPYLPAQKIGSAWWIKKEDWEYHGPHLIHKMKPGRPKKEK